MCAGTGGRGCRRRSRRRVSRARRGPCRTSWLAGCIWGRRSADRAARPVRPSTGGDLVRVHGGAAGQVDDGFDGDLTGGAAPGPDLLGEDREVRVAEPSRPRPVPVIASWDRWRLRTTLRGFRDGCCATSSTDEPDRSRVRSRRAISPRATARRTSNDSSDPSSLSVAAVWLIAESRSRASARSRVPWRVAVPERPLRSWWRVSMSTCRPSAAACWRASASAGMNWVIAVAISRSRAVVRMVWAQNQTFASTYAAASAESPMVARAIRRARQAGSFPSRTWAHVFGRRCRSSRASPTYALPTSVGQADGGGELGDGELRHQGCSGTGDGDGVVAVPVTRGVVDRVGRVHGRPVDGGLRSLDSAASARARI